MSLKKILMTLFTPLIFQGCTETYPLLTNTYKEAIVVEATLTNELKKQEIKITKSAKFEDTDYLPESGAEVFITDDSGNQYNFDEDSEKYVSTIEFQAIPERKYQLHIKTKDGKSFESAPETLTTVSPIESLKATVEIEDKVRGVAIKVQSFDPGNSSKYYRYDYDETYKVVAPKWTTAKLTLNEDGILVPGVNGIETRTCYGNKKSAEILITDTNDQKDDRVNFLVRFISDQNYIITTRYSILVKQYVESLNAYTYYKSLKKMSSSESILSPTQPGILLGNIKEISNSGEKILGYFDVASVSTERLYFNYDDLFRNEPRPPYPEDCVEFCYSDHPSPSECTHTLAINYIDDLERGKIIFFIDDFKKKLLFWVNTACGDCTAIASNIKPAFWID